MSIVTQLKQALIKLGAETVSGDTIATVLKTGLGSITGNALTGNTIATVLNSFNNNHVATVTFSTTPAGTTIVVKSGANVIAPYEDGNYYLEPGNYTYTASAELYVTKADQELIIIEDDVNTTKTVTVSLDEDTAEVVFTLDPVDALIVVKEDETVIAATSGTTYDLEIGSYTYTVTKEGYVTKADQPLEIIASDITETKAITVELLANPVQLTALTDLAYSEPNLSWTGDVNATRYEVSYYTGTNYVSIGSTAATETSYSLGALEPGTYNIAVMAIGDEPGFENYTNSEWSETIEVVIE